MTTKLRAASFQDGAVTTAKIAAAAITNAKIADGAVDSDAIGSSAIVVNKLDIGQIGGRRNMIINGAMQVAQRGTSSTGVGAADNYFTLDRWYSNTNGNSAGRLTMTQTAITDLPEFQNCLKFACTTADTSIAAAERFMLEYKMEGQDAQGLAKGTSSAKPVTVSFYVKGHDSATYTVGLYEGTTGRKIAATFPVTTSWVRQTVTFPGDTTGVIPNNNTAQLVLRFYLHGGSNYTSGTFGTSWNAGGNTVQISSSGNSIFESTSATFFLTGVQMEVSSQATEFEHRSFGEELLLCQRYYQRVDAIMWGHQAKIGDTNRHTNWVLQPKMRATPTLSVTDVRSPYSFGGTNELAPEMANYYLSVGDTTNHVYGNTHVVEAEL